MYVFKNLDSVWIFYLFLLGFQIMSCKIPHKLQMPISWALISFSKLNPCHTIDISVGWVLLITILVSKIYYLYFLLFVKLLDCVKENNCYLVELPLINNKKQIVFSIGHYKWEEEIDSLKKSYLVQSVNFLDIIYRVHVYILFLNL